MIKAKPPECCQGALIDLALEDLLFLLPDCSKINTMFGGLDLQCPATDPKLTGGLGQVASVKLKRRL